MTDLVDLRAKITRRASAALEAEHLATGVDKSELVRQILEQWAQGKEHYCNLLLRSLEREGLEPRANGGRGKGRA
jgi:hypothetical protein